MKIAIFSDTTIEDINGVSTSINTLKTELEFEGHDIILVTSNDKLKSYFDGKVIKVPGKKLKKMYGYNVSTPYHKKIIDTFKKLDVDIIHVHTEFGVGILGRFIAKKLKTPLVATYHTMYEDYTHYFNPRDLRIIEKGGKKAIKILSKRLYNNCDIIISPSLKTKNKLISYGVDANIRVVPTAIDVESFSDAKRDLIFERAIIEKFKLEDNLIFLFIGRVAKEKSLLHTIQAFEFLIEKNPDLKSKFLIIGDGPELDELKRHVLGKDTFSKIYFLGKVPHESVSAYYKIADLFVASSLTETQGLTFNEALAAGLPLLVRTDDVIDAEDIEGFSWLFENEIDFEEKVISYIKLNELEKSKIKKMCHNYASKYNVDIFSKEVLKVYNEAIKINEIKNKKHKSKLQKTKNLIKKGI